MFSHLFAAQAQGGGNTNSGGSGSGTSTGQDGYLITGNANPGDLSKEYEYLRKMPDGSTGVYWHVEGAATIEGAAAGNFPDGSLAAQQYGTLHIQWSEDSARAALKVKNGRPAFVLQLRRLDPKTNTGEVLANLAIGNPFSSISNKIQFHGQVPDNTTNQRFDPLDLCPNFVDGRGDVLSEPYQFEFESNCIGESNSSNCRFKPSFIWTVKYFTESGHEYQEQWKDLTTGDFSKIRLYMYDRVPLPATPTNQQATNAGGNNNFYPWIYSGCVTPPNNTGIPGEVITSVRLECTGYTCGFWGGNDNDGIDIRYNGRKPDPITVAGNPATLCRNMTYQITTNGSLNASGYVWTASSGARFIGTTNSSQVTLDLSDVAASVTDVTVTVRATNANNVYTCNGATSAPTTITLPLVGGLPAPQNLRLTNGTCATSGPNDVKNLLVDGVMGADVSIGYSWSLDNNNAAGAVFTKTNSTTCSPCGVSEAIRAPNSGSFTATVSAKVAADCGYITDIQSQTFSITSSTPTCPIATLPQGLCYGNSYPLVLQNPEPGALYFMFIDNVLPNNGTAAGTAHIIFTQAAGGQPYGQVAFDSGIPPTSFDVKYNVVGACPPVSSRLCGPTTFTFGPNYCHDTGMRPGHQSQPTVVLYPNPTSGQVEIQSGESTHYEWVKVTDVQGRIIVDQKSNAPTGVTRLDLSRVPAGLYEVQLFDGKQLTHQRLVKD